MSPGVQVRIPFEPRVHQTQAHVQRLSHRWTVLVWHRRAGKTVFSVMELILAALACKAQGARFGYVAPLLRQAKEIAWEYLKRYSRPIPQVKINESELSVTYPNGAIIRLYGGDNPDSLRGLGFDGLVIDEVGQIKRSLWFEVLRPTLVDRNGWAIFIGTPKGLNLFSELYYAAHDQKDWYAERRTADETDVISPEELAAMKRELTPQAYAQEITCDFAAAVENARVPLEDIDKAMLRDASPEEFEFAPKIVGVDIARFGDDSTIIAKRQGKVCYQLIAMKGADVMNVVDRVAKVASDWVADAIMIDVTGGLGAGAADRLRQLDFNVLDVDFGSSAGNERYRNKRSEIWGEMARWIKECACLPTDQTLKADLSAPTYYFDTANKECLESKDDIKERLGRSPDRADALACTFAYPMGNKESVDILGRSTSNSHRAKTRRDVG